MRAMIAQLAGGELTGMTVIIWTCFAFLLSALAGAVSGVTLAGKDLGNELAALMGGMFGPVAATPGILIGLILLAFV